MGRPWYDKAKYLTKKNTFNDFVDVARWLVGDEASGDANSKDAVQPSIGKGLTAPSQLSCEGRSAGGLLIGAILNQHPELFKAAILGVPFVDIACRGQTERNCGRRRAHSVYEVSGTRRHLNGYGERSAMSNERYLGRSECLGS
jgi:alpha-beta hydrolase superfamily lysophospholipase